MLEEKDLTDCDSVNDACCYCYFDEKECEREISGATSSTLCDLLTSKLLSYYPLIDFLQQNIVVESDDSALAYTDLS